MHNVSAIVRITIIHYKTMIGAHISQQVKIIRKVYSVIRHGNGACASYYKCILSNRDKVREDIHATYE